MCKKRLILASKSPRRSELMTQMGLKFKVITSDCDENTEGLSPEDTVYELSQRKALAVKELIRASRPDMSAAIIGADTVVALGDGTVLGKPKSKEDALKMLLSLSNTTHRVLTGITLIDGENIDTEVVSTDVHFINIDMQDAMAYVETNEPYDKAGGYGIQGRGGLFVDRIVGDYYNVVGLPICPLSLMLKKRGLI